MAGGENGRRLARPGWSAPNQILLWTELGGIGRVGRESGTVRSAKAGPVVGSCRGTEKGEQAPGGSHVPTSILLGLVAGAAFGPGLLAKMATAAELHRECDFGGEDIAGFHRPGANLATCLAMAGVAEMGEFSEFVDAGPFDGLGVLDAVAPAAHGRARKPFADAGAGVAGLTGGLAVGAMAEGNQQGQDEREGGQQIIPKYS